MLLVLSLSGPGAVRGVEECEVRYQIIFVLVLLSSLGPNGPVARRRKCLFKVQREYPSHHRPLCVSLNVDTNIFSVVLLLPPECQNGGKRNTGMPARVYRLKHNSRDCYISELGQWVRNYVHLVVVSVTP